MKTFQKIAGSTFLTATLAALSFGVYADDTDVNVSQEVTAVLQGTGSLAIGPISADSDALSAAGNINIEGSNLNDIDVDQYSAAIGQITLSGAISEGCGACGSGGMADSGATAVVGAVNIDVNNTGWADINVTNTVDAVGQVTGSAAYAGKKAISAATSAVGIISIESI